jgi:hypothetical protein
MKRVLVLGLLFQGAWFACVLGGAAGTSWPGLLAALPLLALLALSAGSRQRWLAFAAAAAAVGAAADSALAAAGLLVFPHGAAVGWLPVWMLLLWFVFCAALPLLFDWLRGRALIAAVFGGVGGAASYAAAAGFGAVEFPDPTLALAAVGAEWAVFLPLALRLAPRPPAPPAPIAAGRPAPDFDLPAHDGRRIALRDFAGQRVLLWFYPKASTPG